MEQNATVGIWLQSMKGLGTTEIIVDSLVWTLVLTLVAKIRVLLYNANAIYMERYDMNKSMYFMLDCWVLVFSD